MRRTLFLVAAAAFVAGVAAHAYYFAWPAPLLDGTSIESFAYGPEGMNPLQFPRHHRDADPADAALLERVLALVNAAPLSRERVTPREGDLLLILYRADGLEFHLIRSGPRLVGLAEGDRGYVAALASPELAAVLAELQARGDGPEKAGS